MAVGMRSLDGALGEGVGWTSRIWRLAKRLVGRGVLGLGGSMLRPCVSVALVYVLTVDGLEFTPFAMMGPVVPYVLVILSWSHSRMSFLCSLRH